MKHREGTREYGDAMSGHNNADTPIKDTTRGHNIMKTPGEDTRM